jgi:uncharacterized protein YjbI with pentapeptide repeats
MGNQRHLKVLRQGVDAWNEWRLKQPVTELDLTGADLSNLQLSGANLAGANLTKANLDGAHLINVDLTEAFLHGATLVDTKLNLARLNKADLSGADLRHADLGQAKLDSGDLSRANLSYALLGDSFLRSANLYKANLTGVDLRGANLIDANLYDAQLFRTHFRSTRLSSALISKATAFNTIFAELDLRELIGLEEIKHTGPSDISLSVMKNSQGQIPEVFLRGCGLRDWEIEASKLYRDDLTRDQVVDLTYKIHELRSDPLIQFNSCFISYSSSDEEFARLLYSDLQSCGVRCWFAPEDMKIGDRIRHRLDDSIRLHDKLLLILSESSVKSQWIEQEVETALEKERERGYDVLFPVRLDEAVMRVRSGWPALIRKTRHIGDFCQWKNVPDYKKGLTRLLDDLRIVS